MNRDEQPSPRGGSGLRNEEKSASRSLQSLDLHIEELVLHGFAPGDRYAISEAVEHELVRLFIEQGVPPSLMNGGEVARLDAGAFAMAPGAKAGATGTQVAQLVYQGLSQ